MDMLEAAAKLAGVARTEGRAASHPTNAHLVTAEPQADSESGRVLVDFGGDTFTVDGSQYVEVETIGEVSADGGDVVVLLTGSDGGGKQPLVIGQPGAGDRQGRLIAAVQAVADAINQHFWHDENGAHVTQATQDEWTRDASGPNSLWNSLGMLFRDGLNNLLAVLSGQQFEDSFVLDAYTDEYCLTNRASAITSITLDGAEVSSDYYALNADADGESYVSINSDFKAEHAGDTIVVAYRESPTIAFYDGLGNTVARFTSSAIEIGCNARNAVIKMAGGALRIRAINNGTNYVAWIESKTAVAIHARSDDAYGSASLYAGREGRAYAEVQNGQGPMAHVGLGLDGNDNDIPILSMAVETSYTGFRNDSFEVEDVITTFRNRIDTYTGTSGTTTATAQGWRLTYFNEQIAGFNADRSPRQLGDYTFSNGTLTALRDCVLEISGVMRWLDAVAGQRGFGIFESGTVGSGTEHSVFQTWNQTQSLNKSVVFPPQVFSLSSGDQLTFARYDNVGAIYTNGNNFSWVTIRVVG